MRPGWLAAGALLTLLGLAGAPRALVSRGYSPAQPLPSLGEPTSGVEARRWVRVEVPAGLTLETFVQRYHLTARTYVCRRECRGKDLKQAECAPLSGALWIAAGLPEPSEGPPCVEGR
jgi:hypothetical protein